MRQYKVTIYPVTPWSVTVEAKTEEEAKEIALNLDGPTVYSFHSSLEEWQHDICEWPNIGTGNIDIEEE